MHKISAQTAYSLFVKDAATRWKEEIRSGRLGGEDAQRLSKHFNWPQRMEEAIPKMLGDTPPAINPIRGDHTIGPTVRHPNRTVKRRQRFGHSGAGGFVETRMNLKDAIRSAGAGDPQKLQELVGTLGAGGYSTRAPVSGLYGAPGRVTTSPAVGALSGMVMAPKEFLGAVAAGKGGELDLLGRFHEAQEALATKGRDTADLINNGFNSLKTPGGAGIHSANPEMMGATLKAMDTVIPNISGSILPPELRDEIMKNLKNPEAVKRSILQPSGGLISGSHFSPKVLQRELEESHFLSPQTQKFQQAVRKQTGEFGIGGTAKTTQQMSQQAQRRIESAVARAQAARSAPLRKLPGLLWKGMRTAL